MSNQEYSFFSHAIFRRTDDGMSLVVVAGSVEIVLFAAVMVSCAAAICFVEWIGLIESWLHHLRHRGLRCPRCCMSGWRNFAGACGF